MPVSSSSSCSSSSCSSSSSCGCCQCPASPPVWQFEVAGVSTPGCGDCSALNQTYSLSVKDLPVERPSMDGCTWSNSGDGVNTPLAILYYATSGPNKANWVVEIIYKPLASPDAVDLVYTIPQEFAASCDDSGSPSCNGVVEWNTSQYPTGGGPLTADDSGKLLVYTGSGMTTLGTGVAPDGFCVEVKCQGSDSTAFIRIPVGGGKYDYIANLFSLVIRTPKTSDVATKGEKMGGITSFGVNQQSGNYQITIADWAHAIVYTGTTDATFVLPKLNNDMDAIFGVTVINNGTGILTVAGGYVDQLVDNRSNRALMPCQGAGFFSTGTNWVTERGIHCNGLVEWTTPTYYSTGVPADAHGKIFVYRGTGLTTFGTDLDPKGLSYTVKCLGVDDTAIVQIPIGGGKYDYVPNHMSLDIRTPLANDIATIGSKNGGITQFGVNPQAENYVITHADWGRAIVYTGTGGHTFILPTLNDDMDGIMALCVINNGTGVVTVSGEGGQKIDTTLDVRIVFPCQGAWFFSDGSNWSTERGIPCTGVIEWGTSENPFVVTTAHHGKCLTYTGTGEGILDDTTVKPIGFRYTAKCRTTNRRAYIKRIQASATDEFYPEGQSVDFVNPGPSDVATIGVVNPGLTLFGVRHTGNVGTYDVTYGDQGCLIELSPSSVDCILNLPHITDGMNRYFAVAVTNNGTKNVIVTPEFTVSEIDGADSKTIAPCQGCWIFSDGSDWFTERGIPCGTGNCCNGVVEWTNSDDPYFPGGVPADADGKLFIYKGTGVTTFGTAVDPAGICYTIQNKGSDDTALIRLPNLDGKYDYIPLAMSLDVARPKTGDVAPEGSRRGGITQFGSKTPPAGDYQISIADWGRAIIYTGTSIAATYTLPTLVGGMDSLMAVAVINNGEKEVTVAGKPGQLVDGQANRIVLPCQGAWFFSTGTGWVTERGIACSGAVEINDPTTSYALTPKDNGKVIIHKGTGTLLITGSDNQPKGFRCTIKSRGGQDSLIKIDKGGGVFELISSPYSYDLINPGFGDTAANGATCGGLTHFSTKSGMTGTYQIAYSDQARCLEFIGSTDTTWALPGAADWPAGMPSLFGCAITNNGTGTLRLAPNSGAIDNVGFLDILSCQGVWIFFNGSDWFSIRGAPCNINGCDGVVEWTDADDPYFPGGIPASASGKTFVFTGIFDTTFGTATDPAGICYTVKNKSNNAVVRLPVGAGYDYLAPGNSFDVHTPLSTDAGTYAPRLGGVTQFGTKEPNPGDYQITLANWGKAVVYTGDGTGGSGPDGEVIYALPFLNGDMDSIYAVVVVNNGTGSVTVSPSLGQFIDNLEGEVRILFPCQGAWFFSTGSGWVTERGIPCGGVTEVGTEGSTAPFTYDLTDKDHAKQIRYIGAGVMTVPFSEKPRGFFCSFRNDGRGSDSPDSLIRVEGVAEGSGAYTYIPPYQSAKLTYPGPGDFPSPGIGQWEGGLTQFGTQSKSSDFNISKADWGRCIEFKGTNPDETYTFTLPELIDDHDRLMAVAITNNGEVELTIVGDDTDILQTIDGQDSRTLLPCQGAWFFATPEKNWITVRGAPCSVCTGVVEWTEESIFSTGVPADAQGKLFIYRGAGRTVFGTGTDPEGMCYTVKCQGSDSTAYVAIPTGGGSFDYVANLFSLDIRTPLSSDNTPKGAKQGGITSFGVNKQASDYQISLADWSHAIVYTGTGGGAATFTLPKLNNDMDTVFGCYIVNNGDGLLTLNSDVSNPIDGGTSRTIFPCQGLGVMSSGMDWVTERGMTCTGVIRTSSDYALTPKDIGKVIRYTGDGTCLVTGLSQPKGFFCTIQNGGGQDSLVKVDIGGGEFEWLTPSSSYDVVRPGFGDTATVGAQCGGLDHYSVKAAILSDYTIEYSDISRCLEFTGSSDAAWTLHNHTEWPNYMHSLFGCAITNNGEGAITLTPNTPSLIDGFDSLDILPCEGCWIFFDGNNWFSVRGIPCNTTCNGVVEWDSGDLFPGGITADASGKTFVYTGTGTTTFGTATDPTGICYTVKNKGVGGDALIKLPVGSGFDYLAPGCSFEVHTPVSSDAGDYAPRLGGITQFGTKTPDAGDYQIKLSDWGRAIVYTGSGGNTYTLPVINGDMDILIAVSVVNNGTGELTVVPTFGQYVDATLTQRILFPCQGMWFFSNGSGWVTERGQPCTGIVEWDDPLTVTAAHHGKVLLYTGSGEGVLDDSVAKPIGFRYVARCGSKNLGAYIKRDAGGGVFDYYPEGQSVEFYNPGPGDTATDGTLPPGLTLFGVRSKTTDYQITFGDQGCVIEYAGTDTASTFTLPKVVDGINRYFAVAIANNGEKELTLKGTDGQTVDGQPNRIILPCQGAWVFSSGSKWVTERGIACSGVERKESGNYGLTAADNGKVIVYIGSSDFSITGLTALPIGFRCTIKNEGGKDALVKIAIEDGKFEWLAPNTSYDVVRPGFGDVATVGAQCGGLTHYSVKNEGSGYTVVYSDMSRCLEFTGGNTTWTLGKTDWTDPMHKLFGCAIVNNSSSGQLTLQPAVGNIDNLSTRVLYPCQGIWVFFDGSNWTSVRGIPCVIVNDTNYVRNPNFNNTTPVAIAGAKNVKWQSNTDMPDKISACVEGMKASGSSHPTGRIGVVPDPGAVAGTAKYLREDATWVIPGFDIGGKFYSSSPQTVSASTQQVLSISSTLWDTNFFLSGNQIVFSSAGNGKYIVNWSVQVDCTFSDDDVAQTAFAYLRTNGSSLEGGSAPMFRSTYQKPSPPASAGDSVQQNFQVGNIFRTTMINITSYTTDYIEILADAGTASLGSSVSVNYSNLVVSVQKVNRAAELF